MDPLDPSPLRARRSTRAVAAHLPGPRTIALALLAAAVLPAHHARAQRRPTAPAAPAALDPLQQARRANVDAATRLALPRAGSAAALDALPPGVRVLIEPDGVSLDQAPLFASWPAADRALLAARLPAPWPAALPLAYRGLVALNHFELPEAALRGGARGTLVVPLAVRVEDLAWIDREVSVAAATGTVAPRVVHWAQLFADAATPTRTLYRVLYTLANGGYGSFALAVRGPRATGAVRIAAPAMTETPPLVTVKITREGYTLVHAEAGYVQPGCAAPAPTAAVSLPITQQGAARRHDDAGLRQCLTRLRPNAALRLGSERRINVAADPEIEYGTVVATLLAVRESRPGARDLFPEPALGILEPGVAGATVAVRPATAPTGAAH